MFLIIPFLMISSTLIGLSIKTEYWKFLEEKHKTIPKEEFEKLEVPLSMDYGNGAYKNMFGLGLNKDGIIIYPAVFNKLTHKNILIPYTEIKQYDMDSSRLSFRKYKEVRLYLKRNSITFIITESATEVLINQLAKHIN